MFAICEKLSTLEHRREPQRQSDRVHQPLADGDRLQSRRACRLHFYVLRPIQLEEDLRFAKS
jgi:hypothetical protein